MPHERDCSLRADFVATSATLDQWVSITRDVVSLVKAEGGDEIDAYEQVMLMVQESVLRDIATGAFGRPCRAITIMALRLAALPVDMSTVDAS